ncbi:DUF3168 domain-containing protein [Pseudomonas typographi]|uniref:DUF3168 domain-containing protein n=1 Tax=Pseudomonas typographi TaxID=2715964 RepID=A0ABR7ZAF5_9PSED|nr:DUF3168 domain-containing protein [Pseudomonas typographi]MBD1602248.1 DUF3168 domain-containing protein [Pseudomonas typographi]
MVAPIFKVCAASPAVTALLGESPTRLYPFGEAPEKVTKPYAVWQVISGSPLNFVNGIPDTDRYGLQVDIYGDTGASVEAVATAIRTAIAKRAYVTAFNVEGKDPDTHSYRKSFDVGWLARAQ